MSDSLIIGLVASIFGGALVAITNHIFTRNRTNAEAKKLEAEAEKIKAETAKLLSDMNLEKESTLNMGRLPTGWISAGSHPNDYEMGVDHRVVYSGRFSGYIKSLPSAKGFGTLMQTIRANNYHGERLRLSGFVKQKKFKIGLASGCALTERIINLSVLTI